MKITTVARVVDRDRLAVILIGKSETAWHFRTKWLDRDTLKTSNVYSAFTPKSIEIITEMLSHLQYYHPAEGEVITVVVADE